ncbi:riboflavin synthase subunit beta [Croceiramulus getboli]|nr:riboflavin synthase subunit beta [Flavobacteriaceae bacterium YJPT1-3]
MGILKQPKNKRFSYTPRYNKEVGEESPYALSGKFDEYRSTLQKKNLKDKFQSAWNDYKSPTDRQVKRRLLYIILILIFIFLWIIDFDLSIFTETQPLLYK